MINNQWIEQLATPQFYCLTTHSRYEYDLFRNKKFGVILVV